MDVQIENFGRALGGKNKEDRSVERKEIKSCGGLAAVEMKMTPESESSHTRWGAGK